MTADIVPLPYTTSIGHIMDRRFALPEDMSFEKARKPLHEEYDAPYSPCTPQPQSDISFDSEEDSEAAYSQDDSGARIGPNFQADLTDIFGSEINSDEPELLWDPDTMADDAIDVLFAQCHVNNSTYKQIQSARASASTPSSTTSSEHLHPSSRPVSPKATEIADTGDRFLDLWSMVLLVNSCGYKPDVVLETLKLQSLFGWSTLKTAFTPWTEEEKTNFESAFSALVSPKHFDQVATHVGTRSTGECIEYYYGWKHSERRKACRLSASATAADDPVPLSRMLPSSARKRKRDVDLPTATLDSGERMYLEALDYLHKTSESPELLLNIVLDTPNFLSQDGVAGLHHDASALPLDDSALPLSASAPIAASTGDAPDAMAAHASAGHFEEHSTLAGAENISVIPRLSNAAASPKRPKLAELDDHIILHSTAPVVDLPLTASTSALAGGSPYDFHLSATIDPHNMFFSPVESTMDLFMHF